MKLVHGVGINDVDYPVTKTVMVYEGGKHFSKQIWMCPFYRKWVSMLLRGHSESYKKKRPHYKKSLVDSKWHHLSVFKSWMENQPYIDHELDKDLLFPENYLYSEETCSFIPPKINILLTDNLGKRNPDGLLGVYSIQNSHEYTLRKPYLARVGTGGKSLKLGSFSTLEEGHFAWQLGKANYIRECIDWWKNDDYFKISFTEQKAKALASRAEYLEKCNQDRVIVNQI